MYVPICPVPICPGTNFGKLGTLIENPGIKIQSVTDHALKRMTERNITREVVDTWVKTGKALEQAGDKILYITKQGAAVVTRTGKLITAYGKDFFDSTMDKVIEQLFGK